MTSDQISKIIELKRIPLTAKMAFYHYFLAIIMAVVGCFLIYKFIWNDLIDGENVLLVMGILCLIPATFIFLYLGKRQLKLQKINIQFGSNHEAFITSKETFNCLKWTITEENGENYLMALRHYTFFGKPHPSGVQALTIFIEDGQLFAISLYYPNSQCEFTRRHKKNIALFEKKMHDIIPPSVLA